MTNQSNFQAEEPAGTHLAFVDVDLALVASESVGTLTGEIIDSIRTGTPVEARKRGAFIDIRLALHSAEARKTFAYESEFQCLTLASVVTGQ